MVHDSVPREASAIDQELEGELQPGIHLPPPRLALAFFSSFLQNYEIINALHLTVAVILFVQNRGLYRTDHENIHNIFLFFFLAGPWFEGVDKHFYEVSNPSDGSRTVVCLKHPKFQLGLNFPMT